MLEAIRYMFRFDCEDDTSTSNTAHVWFRSSPRGYPVGYTNVRYTRSLRVKTLVASRDDCRIQHQRTAVDILIQKSLFVTFD